MATPQKKFEKAGVLYSMSERCTWSEVMAGYIGKKKIFCLFRNGDDFKNYVDYDIPSYAESLIELQNSHMYVNARYVDLPEAAQCCFEICTRSRSYFFACKNEQDMQDWVYSIGVDGVPLKTPNRPTPESLQIKFRRVFGIQGLVQKRGEWNKSFKERILRTSENAAGHKVVAYYAKPCDSNPKGIIPLSGAQLIDKVDGIDASSNDMIIKTKGRDFVLRFPNYKEKEQWKDVLSSLIDGSADSLFDVPEEQKQQQQGNDAFVMTDNNYYDVLGVHPTSDNKAISRAYRHKAKEFHPDRNPSPIANAQFHLLKEAYEVLASPQSRLKYDTELAEKQKITVDQLRNRWKLEKGLLDMDKKANADDDDDEDDDDDDEDGNYDEDDITNNAPRESIDAAEEFLKDANNMCLKCTKKPKALYCLDCQLDICLSCSKDIHVAQNHDHKRVPMHNKENYLQQIKIPGTREYKEHKARMKAKSPTSANHEDTFPASPTSHTTVSTPAVVVETVSDDHDKKEKKEKKEKKKKMKALTSEPHSLLSTAVVPIQTESKEEIERRILEEKRIQEEEEKKKMMQELMNGCEFHKISSWGDPKLTKVSLQQRENDYIVTWESKKKSLDETIIFIKDAQLLRGQITELFRKKKQMTDKASMSFSLVSSVRSLDLVATNVDDYNKWTRALERLIVDLRNNQQTIAVVSPTAAVSSSSSSSSS